MPVTALSWRRRIGAAAIAAAVLPAPAAALDVGLRDAGVRAGVSLDPDQVHGGLDAEVARRGRLAVRPSIEIGIGNGARLGAVNGDVLWRVGSRRRAFVGGGPVFTLVDVTDGVGEGRGVESGVGGNLVTGIRWGGAGARGRAGRRYLLEGRVGFGDTPDVKLTVGASF